MVKDGMSSHFLFDLKPEGGQVVFHDETDDEAEGLRMATGDTESRGDNEGRHIEPLLQWIEKHIDESTMRNDLQ